MDRQLQSVRKRSSEGKEKEKKDRKEKVKCRKKEREKVNELVRCCTGVAELA